MDAIIFHITTIFVVVTLVIKIKDFWSNPLGFDNVAYLMYAGFYYLPAIDYWYNLNLFSQELIRLTGYSYSTHEVVKFSLISYVVMVSFMLGFKVKFTYDGRTYFQTDSNVIYEVNINKLKLAKNVLILLLILVLISGYSLYGYNIRTFFSMARKETLNGSWQRTLIGILPAPILGLEYIEETRRNRKISNKYFVYSILCLFVVMILGQRRELMNTIVFIVLLFIDAKTNQYYEVSDKKVSKVIRKYVIALGVLIAILVPVTWYMRVYSTQMQYGNIVNPFAKRGWLELLFGSSSSGLQTSVAIDEFKEDYGLPFIPSVRLLLTLFIPRSLFQEKAAVITYYLKETLHTSFNLSVFYINDIWFNFYYMSPIFSFIIGCIIYQLTKNHYKDTDSLIKIPVYYAFSLSISFFKNGFVQFFMSYLTFFVIWVSVRKYSCRRNI